MVVSRRQTLSEGDFAYLTVHAAPIHVERVIWQGVCEIFYLVVFHIEWDQGVSIQDIDFFSLVSESFSSEGSAQLFFCFGVWFLQREGGMGMKWWVI